MNTLHSWKKIPGSPDKQCAYCRMVKHARGPMGMYQYQAQDGSIMSTSAPPECVPTPFGKPQLIGD